MRMNHLQVFAHTEFGHVEVIQIDGKEWFSGTQVAKALGYSNPRDAIAKHCRKKGVAKRDVLTPGGPKK